MSEQTKLEEHLISKRAELMAQFLVTPVANTREWSRLDKLISKIEDNLDILCPGWQARARPGPIDNA